MLPETLRTIYGDPDADATEFGTKYFVWGTPLDTNPATPSTPTQRRLCGARFTYRIRPGESNHEFEARIHTVALKFLSGSGTLYIEGEMTFSRHRYTEAALILYHPPIVAPIEVPKMLRRPSAAA
ncbi:hypothetical protein [Herpetosiphon llansteffanensis]|uniref:hypothetical protein n=1 Tax=Herpetosiphon llansteffanensis TaxID=2094568 RepID=UPI000D7C6405|nr:hypothetical protein [Herpetosiphon llansteffanensis]